MRKNATGLAIVALGVLLLIVGLAGWAQPCNSYQRSVSGTVIEFQIRDWSTCREMAGIFNTSSTFTVDTTPLSQSISRKLAWIKARTILGLVVGSSLLLVGVAFLVRSSDAPLNGRRISVVSACIAGCALFFYFAFSIYLEKLETLEWRKSAQAPAGFTLDDPGNLVSHKAIRRQLILLWLGGAACLGFTVWVVVRPGGASPHMISH